MGIRKEFRLVITYEEFKNRPYPPESWLIDQLIPSIGSTYLHGSSKMGKTFLALGMALAVSEGWDSFLGLKVKSKGKILYVQVDMPPTIFKDYLKGIEKEATDPTLSKFHIIDRWTLPDGVFDISKPKYMDMLREATDKVQPVLTFFDTFRSIHSKNENDNTEMSILIEKLKKSMGNIPFVLLHHPKKPGLFDSGPVNEARGATTVPAAVDVIAQLKGGKKKRTLIYSTRKANDYEEGIPIVQDITTGLYKVKNVAAILRDKILADNPKITPAVLVKELIDKGIPSATAYRTVNGS